MNLSREMEASKIRRTSVNISHARSSYLDLWLAFLQTMYFEKYNFVI